MNIVERVRDICQKLDVPISRLEQDLGFGNGFLNPKKIGDLKVSRLLKILNYLGISVADFFGPKFVQEELTDLQKKYNALDDHGRELVDLILGAEYKRCMKLEKQAEIVPIRMIRHYLVPAAAGYASPIAGEEFEEIPLPEDAPAGADFCITIQGDSMEPYIHDGQMVFVKREAQLQEFDVGVFYVDGDVFCKQWCVDFAGTLHLLSANPKREDANISIPKEANRSCICFGKVLLPHRLPQPAYD